MICTKYYDISVFTDIPSRPGFFRPKYGHLGTGNYRIYTYNFYKIKNLYKLICA